MSGAIPDPQQLDELLSRPSDAAVDALSRIEGDILLLGVGGKMGPTMARMARRAAQQAGTRRRVIGVSRFSQPAVRESLDAVGVETIRGDLLDAEFLSSLPDAPNVFYLVGRKFGTTSGPAASWILNTYAPALICQRYRQSRIVALSTGNIYGLVPVDGPGSTETDLPDPVGEYAMSCLGRERVFEYFSARDNIPTTLIRLNYAQELRYGVLVDLAEKINAGEPIDLAMGYVNVIWQGDASGMILASLADTSAPPARINVAGAEKLSVRAIAVQLAERLGKPARFRGTESKKALLSQARLAYDRYGRPQVSVPQMVEWVADWIKNGRETLGKPTHFESIEGKF